MYFPNDIHIVLIEANEEEEENDDIYDDDMYEDDDDVELEDFS